MCTLWTEESYNSSPGKILGKKPKGRPRKSILQSDISAMKCSSYNQMVQMARDINKGLRLVSDDDDGLRTVPGSCERKFDGYTIPPFSTFTAVVVFFRPRGGQGVLILPVLINCLLFSDSHPSKNLLI